MSHELYEGDAWHLHLVEDPKYRKASCYITPKGEWYNVPFSLHETFATSVCRELFPTLLEEHLHRFDLDARSSHILMSNGWIFVHDDPFVGTVVNGYHKMNEAQHRVLKEFFEDNLLFRGWTIDGLYEEAKKEAVI